MSYFDIYIYKCKNCGTTPSQERNFSNSLRNDDESIMDMLISGFSLLPLPPTQSIYSASIPEKETVLHISCSTNILRGRNAASKIRLCSPPLLPAALPLLRLPHRGPRILIRRLRLRRAHLELYLSPPPRNLRHHDRNPLPP